MAAQIVSRIGVRAEWLLTGAGPVMQDEPTPELAALLAPTIRSVFPVFTATSIPGPGQSDRVYAKPKRIFSNNSTGAARVMQGCRIAGKPVCFFLGADALSQHKARADICKILDRKFLTELAFTASAATRELDAPIALNTVVRMAAMNGVGLGEAFSRWAVDSKKNESLFAKALGLKLPITVHAEFGELPAHLEPDIRGTELGAAWGAAAYVDHLVFAEQVRAASGIFAGTFVIVGEPERWCRLLLATVRAVRSAVANEYLNTFHVIQVGSTPHDIQEQVNSHGGHFYHIKGKYTTAVNKLLRACDDVYDGNIPHDHSKRSRVRAR